MSQGDDLADNLLLLVCESVHSRFKSFGLQVANQLCVFDLRPTLAIFIIIVALVVHAVQVCLESLYLVLALVVHAPGSPGPLKLLLKRRSGLLDSLTLQQSLLDLALVAIVWLTDWLGFFHFSCNALIVNVFLIFIFFIFINVSKHDSRAFTKLEDIAIADLVKLKRFHRLVIQLRSMRATMVVDKHLRGAPIE